MNEKIPFHRPFPLPEIDLRTIQTEIRKVLKSGQLSKNGIWCQKLEERIKEIYDVKYVLATSNCTSGIMICLDFLENRYIQVPMFQWKSVGYVLEALKKDVKWVDIDPETWLPQMDGFGYGLYINTFGNIGSRKEESNGCDTIYDSSHCLGGKIKEWGLAHVFSLAPTKLITSCEGGLILTNDRDLYNFAKERRDTMARMSEIHAVIGNMFLDHMNLIMGWKNTFTIIMKNIFQVNSKKYPIILHLTQLGF